MKLSDPSPRVPVLDVAKALGILLVLYGHGLELSFAGNHTVRGSAFSQWQVIYAFHMPLFFFLSGVIFRPRDLRAEVGNALEWILLAYTTHILGCLFAIALGLMQPSIRGTLYPLLKGNGFSLIVTWFLVTLALTRLAFVVVQTKSRRSALALVLGIIACYAIKTLTGYNYFHMAALFPALAFYWLGFKLRPVIIVAVPRAPYLLLAFLLILIASRLAPLNLGCAVTIDEQCSDVAEEFGVLVNSGRIGFLPTFFLNALVGLTGVLALSLATLFFMPRLAVELASLGQRTLHLFILNGFFMVLIQPYFKPFLPEGVPVWLASCWALGFTVVQLLILRYWMIPAESLLRYNRALSDWLIAQVAGLSTRLFRAAAPKI